MNSPASPLPAGENLQMRTVLGSVFRGWDRFWFSRMDPTTLCFIRLFCGLLTFYVHLTYSWGLLSYVGPEGWIDHDLARYIQRDAQIYVQGTGWDEELKQVGTGNYFWSVYFEVTSPRWIVAIHVFFLVSMLAFAAGLLTRITGAITWAGAMCYVHRASSTVFGLDTMMLILLLYLMIGPSGATLSVDRWLSKWWARRRGRPEPEVQPSYSANFAIRLIQVHLCLIYLAGGTSKLLGPTWWSGTALNLVMLNYAFAPLDFGPYYKALKALAAHRWLWELVMTGGIVSTLMLEIGFPFLVWDRRWRWVMVCGSVCMHTVIAVCMGLTTFSLMMIIMVSSFIPPEVIARLVDRVQQSVLRLLRPNQAGPAGSRREGELVLSN
jgi:hypothetical protein